jgi:hypothetical protein
MACSSINHAHHSVVNHARKLLTNRQPMTSLTHSQPSPNTHHPPTHQACIDVLAEDQISQAQCEQLALLLMIVWQLLSSTSSHTEAQLQLLAAELGDVGAADDKGTAILLQQVTKVVLLENRDQQRAHSAWRDLQPESTQQHQVCSSLTIINNMHGYTSSAPAVHTVVLTCMPLPDWICLMMV